MRCPTCGAGRVARVVTPGEGPDGLLVCLTCAQLWAEDPADVPSDPGR